MTNCLFERFGVNQGKGLSPMSGSTQNGRGQGAKRASVGIEMQVKLGVQWWQELRGYRKEVTLRRNDGRVSPILQSTLNLSQNLGWGLDSILFNLA